MTREGIIECIFNDKGVYSCPDAYCAVRLEGEHYEVACRRCAEKQLAEYEQKVREEAIDEYTEWLRKAHANFDEDYAEDIKSDYLEQLKEQKE